jgi:glycosyltransferase involved in cell wall biosynthesis
MNKKKPIRIGIDATNIRRGGGVTHLIEILSVLDPSKYGINEIILWGGSSTLDSIQERPWLVKLNPKALNKGLLKRAFWQRFYLSKAAYESKCDILFVPGGSFLGSFKPVVTMSQNLLPFEISEVRRYGFSIFTIKLLLLRLVQSISFQKSDGIIFLSKYAQNLVFKATSYRSTNTQVIPHGLSSRFYLKPRKQLSIKEYSTEQPFHILYVSIIDEYKHQWHVVDAVADLRRMGLPIVIDLIGPAYQPSLKKLNKKIKSLDSESEWIFYHGAISYEKLHNYYKNSDLGLFASSCENMPIILLEMMASGLPIACSNNGPMPEVLGNAGLYFSPEHPKDISNTLIKLIKSPSTRMKLAELSFEKSKKYSWERCGEETFSFISNVNK